MCLNILYVRGAIYIDYHVMIWKKNSKLIYELFSLSVYSLDL